jgi:transposase
VLYDITSTYFEGAGPHDFAKHGYSRDGKPQNVQVIVGVVMVAGWPIAHHVWAGNRVDHSTVQEVISDLRKRFAFGRLVFVGDRGMVTDENIESITKDKHGFLVGIKRRRHAELDAWLDAVDDTKWVDCPGGINTRERKTDPPRTRAQEVPSGNPDMRVIVIDSDERRGYEQSKREQAMERARQGLEKLGSVSPRATSSAGRSGLPSGESCRNIMRPILRLELNGGAAGVLRRRTHLEA